MSEDRALHDVARRTASPQPFACTWTNDNLEAPWVHVSGELDVATTPQLERTLREAQLHVRVVVLDMRLLSFLDSFGMRAIISACIRARAGGKSILLLRGSGVSSVFRHPDCVDQVELVISEVGPAVRALLRQPA